MTGGILICRVSNRANAVAIAAGSGWSKRMPGRREKFDRANVVATTGMLR